MSLMQELNAKALRLGLPLSVHLDLTYRCNERCEHCYLEHDDRGEMSLVEIRALLRDLADAGVFFLTLSGGEPLMRRDCFEIIESARALGFNVKLKTNAVMVREKEARRLRALGVEQVQISLYSHRAEVHDGITKLPGSLKRTLAGIRLLRSAGLRVTLANVLMPSNFQDSAGVRALAAEVGAHYTRRSHDYSHDGRKHLDPALSSAPKTTEGSFRRPKSRRQCRRVLRTSSTGG